MNLSLETGQLCRQADQFLAARAKVESPLLRAQSFAKGLEWTNRLRALQSQIQLRRDELLAELQKMNTIWSSAPPAPSPARAQALPLARLDEICRGLSQLSRCGGQIHERLAQLSF